MKRRIKIYFLLSITLLFCTNFAQANCKDPELRQKVTQTAKEEGVNENELLSIIAHESQCRYFAIAWNLPRQPSTAKSKFFNSLEEAKAFAESFIETKKYRVDVGIGQINNEAHIQPKGWSLEEVLNPETALNKVAQVLKERTWANYHSSSPKFAKKWQLLAINSLLKLNKRNADNLEINSKLSFNNLNKKKLNIKNESTLIVYNSLKKTSDIKNNSSNNLIIFFAN